MARCPTCGKTVVLQETPAPPFCSARCRQIDLSRWLDERYSLPVESDDESNGDDRQEDVSRDVSQGEDRG